MELKTIIYLIFSLLVLSIPGQLTAETENYSNLRFKSYSTKQGLSQSSVLCMVQDHKGFIWMGTKDGLNRFDGYTSRHFKHYPTDTFSLSSNEILCLSCNPDGDILIGTRGGGLNKYLYQQGLFLHYPGLFTPDQTVSAIYYSNDGSCFAGTTEGLFLCEPTGKDPHQYTFTNLSSISTYYNPNGNVSPYFRQAISVVSIAHFAPGQLLIGTEGGLFVFDVQEKSFRQLQLNSLNYSKVSSLVWDSRKKGVLWVGTSEGIVRLEFSNGQLINNRTYQQIQQERGSVVSNWINALVDDFNGTIWAGTRGNGLIKIDSTGKVSQYFSDFRQSNRIGDNLINSLLIDRTGVLWIGTESRGGVSLDLFSKKFYHLENNTTTGLSLTNNLVTAITGSGRTVWIGTAFNGLNRLEFLPDNTISTQHIARVPIGSGRSSNEIISLLLDRSHTLWIGTASNNVLTYSPEQGYQQLYAGGFVFSIWQDREDDIWLGTWGQGLGLFDRHTRTINLINPTGNVNQSLGSDKVLAIFDDTDGNLWVGTKGGGLNIVPLRKIKQGYQQFTQYRSNENDSLSLAHNDILCIFQDSHKTYWIGTGNGLSRVVFPQGNQNELLIQGKARFKTYTIKNGLPGNVVYGIAEDRQGLLWLSTIHGLSCFNPQTGTFKNFNESDGVQSNELHSNAFYQSGNSMIFLGGDKGISFFNPSEISSNPFQSNTIISDLKIMNRTIYPNESLNGRILLKQEMSNTRNITLTPKEKEFTIEFSGLHFANPEGIKYAYRLLGFNNDWQYTTGWDHTATYTNLWEGQYTFQVRSANNDGVWDEETREVTIKVLPPFWRSRWFYLVYILIIISGLLLFRRYSLIAVSEKNRLMIERIERKNLIENSEAKMRFFTNISHEIRTPLTLISNPIEDLIAQENIDEPSRNKLKLVAKNAARLLNLTNQLLQLRRIDKGGIEPHFVPVLLAPFVNNALGYFEQKAAQKSIELTFNSEIDPGEQIYIDAEMITTALYNLISNSFKFTPRGGKISVRIYKKTGEVKLFKVKKQVREQNLYAIEVSDSGSGIPPQDLDKIFIRFFQGKGSGEGESAGSGIGLSLVKEYVDIHKGRIEAESTKGKGTSMTILLPAGEEHNQDQTTQEQPLARVKTLPVEEERWPTEVQAQKPEQHAEGATTLPKILIVEDDIDLAHYLALSLGSHYRTSICHNGKSGLAKAREWEPNLVISDVMMPEMNGIEMCQAIKSDIETSHIPVILLTANLSEENTFEGYQSGADLYITKPFKIELLVLQVRQLLQNRRQLQEKFSRQILLKPHDITITSIDEQFLEKMNKIIEENLAETDFDVSEMVKHMNMSHSTVLKKIKALTGMPLVEFVKNQRLKRAAQILIQDKLQIAEVAYMVGFSDPKYFSKCFSKAFGMTPTDYVAKNKTRTDTD